MDLVTQVGLRGLAPGDDGVGERLKRPVVEARVSPRNGDDQPLGDRERLGDESGGAQHGSALEEVPG